MICELVVKCATLILVIHVLRLIGRRAGPRASGLLLGLPSSSAVLLVLCGREKGTALAVEMADASLLGLIAAVVLPLVYARAIRCGWSLPAALGAAVAGYVVVASGLGLVHPAESAHRLALSFGSILAATLLACRIGAPAEAATLPVPSSRWIAAVRTIIPIVCILVVGIVTGVASPRWAGLFSTFPSMSTVVLAVTHLEEGAVAASRIARALPPANLSTAAFLAAFRFGSPILGLPGGVLCGYLAALTNLAAIELIPRSWRLGRLSFLIGAILRPPAADDRIPWRRIPSIPRVLIRPALRHAGRIRPPHRRPFSPRLEILPC